MRQKARYGGSRHHTGESGHLNVSLTGTWAKDLVKTHFLYLNDFKTQVTISLLYTYYIQYNVTYYDRSLNLHQI